MKVALVTGATSGIGRAAALALGEAGWWVLVTGRDEARAREVAEQLESGGQALALDLNGPGAPRRAVEAAREGGGRLDLLVNNAGVHALATVPDTDEALYDELMNTNLRAATLLAGEALRAMRETGGGTIVNVSSEAGLVAVRGQAVYNISKAGLVMLTRAIAVDHAHEGIRAVSICPGTTRTPLVDRAIAGAEDPEAHERTLANSRPLGRLGTSEEIAAAIVFAASEEASFMTGTELVVDGGYTAA